jgi:hypothetical protein
MVDLVEQAMDRVQEALVELEAVPARVLVKVRAALVTLKVLAGMRVRMELLEVRAVQAKAKVAKARKISAKLTGSKQTAGASMTRRAKRSQRSRK